VLPELTAEDLIGLGVASIGHRRKMLAAIARLHVAEASAPQDGAPSFRRMSRPGNPTPSGGNSR
jgi:hypothetical protein